MKSSKLVTVIHPDHVVRRSLSSALRRHGYRVAADHSCRNLLSRDPGISPDVILLDRSVLSESGEDVLSELRCLWDEAQTLFLPEGLNHAGGSSLSSLLEVLERLLSMRSIRDLLA